MKMFMTTAAVMALFTAPALAADLDIGGSFDSSASSFSGTAGGSFGNGASMSSASQFSGATSTISGEGQLGSNSGSLTGTVTTETFTEGASDSWSTGNALTGAGHAGFGSASGATWGSGGAQW